ncbi:MAG: OFA family MFS transporter [Methylococcales bacterium]|nr:OFA family MFS transporter [Methylococcales bacterium]
MPGFFSKQRITASSDYNRWKVPGAALAVHLCIGQVYAFSVFNEPLTRVIGIDHSTPEDWKLTELGWIFSLAIVFLGLSAAIGGKWLEQVGPRLTTTLAALCFGGGFWVAALGIDSHQIELLYLGYGVLGGMGLGLGYVSPVSTLIKWFPDRRGMATGLAIMGFGGGALLGAPLSVALMELLQSPQSVGVKATFQVLGSVYFLLMMLGALTIRIPPDNWQPNNWTPPKTRHKMIARYHVHIDQALKTPQFYWLWLVLCLNVTAGIGVLGQAAVMIQEMFKDQLSAANAAAFVSLLSLFNMAGRFFWSTLSDYLGRKNTFTLFFLLGATLYAFIPSAGAAGNMVLFVGCYALVLSMYGGGFATIPAYLADIFGTRYVGGIHGRLLTAWSTAGVLGPVLVNYLRAWQLDQGVARADAYTMTLYIMSGILLLGGCCNLMIRPVHSKHHQSD